VEDEAVNQSLERIREKNARFEAVESGAVEASHTVVVGLERRGTDKDGKQGDVDKHEQVSIELGAPSNPPGFDAEVIGMTPGSSKSFTITYPEDYTIPELAGGKVDYTVNLKEIKKRVVPALDDELAKDLGDFSSLEEAAHARARGSRARGDARGGAPGAPGRAEAARDARAVPRARVARRARDRSPPRGFRAAPDGSADRSAAGEHRLERVPRRPARPATEAVGSAIVLDEVAKRDQIDVTDDDLDAELQRYAEQAGHSVASIRARLQKDGELGAWRRGCGAKKTVAHVMSKAQIRKG
jgi:trigger factor